MDLKKRLAQLDRLSRKSPRSEAAGDSPDEQGPERPAVGRSPASLGLTEGAGGNYWFRETRTTATPLDLNATALRGFFTRRPPAETSASRLLFMDTETTGLAGGTGTVPFLVGLGWWEPTCFVTRQYFLPAPGREAGLLGAVAETAASFDVVVTYNGGSFDLPLVRTRSLLNRLEDPFGGLTSWDLVVPVRRLWRRRLPDCRQQTVERVVDFTGRGGEDIPGAQIPQIWFDFLAGEDDGCLAAVLDHNHWDLLGMAAILERIAETAGWLHRELRPPADWPWQDLWSLARIALVEKRTDRAANLFVSAMDDTPLADTEASRYAEAAFVRDAIVAFKRQRDWAAVQRIIDAALTAGLDHPWLHREAAILYEHRLVDLNRALDFAQRSGEPRRMKRLQRRLDSGAGAGA